MRCIGKRKPLHWSTQCFAQFDARHWVFCYNAMSSGCSKLSKVTMSGIIVSASYSLSSWLNTVHNLDIFDIRKRYPERRKWFLDPRFAFSECRKCVLDSRFAFSEHRKCVLDPRSAFSERRKWFLDPWFTFSKREKETFQLLTMIWCMRTFDDFHSLGFPTFWRSWVIE